MVKHVLDMVGPEMMQSLPPLPEALTDAIEGFFTKFAEDNNGQPISIKRCAEIIEVVTMPVVEVINPDLVRAGLEMQWEQWENSGEDVPFDLDAVDLDEVLPVGTAVLKSYLKSGAQKRWFAALLRFLDVNNDGDISMQELRGLYDLYIQLQSSNNEEEYYTNSTLLLLHIFDIFDSDGSGTFDMEDAPLLYDKFVELFSALSYLFVEGTKAMVLAMILPALNVGFAMFTEDGSISLEMVEMLAQGMMEG